MLSNFLISSKKRAPTVFELGIYTSMVPSKGYLMDIMFICSYPILGSFLYYGKIWNGCFSLLYFVFSLSWVSLQTTTGFLQRFTAPFDGVRSRGKSTDGSTPPLRIKSADEGRVGGLGGAGVARWYKITILETLQRTHKCTVIRS